MNTLFRLAAFGAAFACAGILFGDATPDQNDFSGRKKPPPSAKPQTPAQTPSAHQGGSHQSNVPNQTQDQGHHDRGGHHPGWTGQYYRPFYRPYYYYPGYVYRPYGYGFASLYPYSLSPYDYAPFYPSRYALQSQQLPQLAANENYAPQNNRIDAEKPDLPDRATNQQSVALGWKFIGYGDVHFSKQKYFEALDRYRMAAQAAPQLADAYFRQGLAQIAIGRYEAAAKALKRGLDDDPKWPESGFKLEEIYGDDDGTKQLHLDALARAAEKHPTDGDLLFLVGVSLHFDRQKDRAKPFFRRAAELTENNSDAINAFLAE